MVEELRARVKGGTPATREEYLALAELHMERELMMQLVNPCEDNCVNRFAVNMEEVLPQDAALTLELLRRVLERHTQAKIVIRAE